MQACNKYTIKPTLVLSSLSQVTLYGVRSKRLVSLRQSKHSKEGTGRNTENAQDNCSCSHKSHKNLKRGGRPSRRQCTKKYSQRRPTRGRP